MKMEDKAKEMNELMISGTKTPVKKDVPKELPKMCQECPGKEMKMKAMKG